MSESPTPAEHDSPENDSITPTPPPAPEGLEDNTSQTLAELTSIIETTERMRQPAEVEYVPKVLVMATAPYNAGDRVRRIGNWQLNRSGLWVSGPRGCGRTSALVQKASRMAEERHKRASAPASNNAPKGKILVVVNQPNQASAWREWAESKSILNEYLDIHTPESLTEAIFGTYYQQLNYRNPPTWINSEQLRSIASDVLKEIQVNLTTLPSANTDNSFRTGLTPARRSKRVTIEDYDQLIIDQLTSNGQSYHETANSQLSRLLPNRPDLRHHILETYEHLVAEEPENWDEPFYGWISQISFGQTIVSSLFKLNGTRPRNRAEREKPKWLQQRPFGIPSGNWEDTQQLLRPVRTRYPEKSSLMESENESVPLKRHLELTIWGENGMGEINDLTGRWIKKHLEFALKEPTEVAKRIRPNKHHGAENDYKAPITVGVFFNEITDTNTIDYYNWRNYFVTQEPQIVIRPLTPMNGPVSTFRWAQGMTGRENYVWFGNVIACGATEFDYVLIPRLEIPEWAEDAETGWDWLDLAVSRARIGAYACTTTGFIPPWLRQVIEDGKNKIKDKERSYTPTKEEAKEELNHSAIGAEKGHLLFQALYQRTDTTS